MKKILLLILTLCTLKAIGQDTITTEKPVDPLLSNRILVKPLEQYLKREIKYTLF